MTPVQLQTCRQLTIRCGAVLRQLQRLYGGGIDVSGQVLADLDRLEQDLVTLTHEVQSQVVDAWRQEAVRAEPSRALRRPPLSTDVAPNVPVERFDMTGRRQGEQPERKPITGRWAANRRPPFERT